MGIEVIYFFGIQLAVGQGLLHSCRSAFAFRMRGRHMVGIGRHSRTGYFSIDFGSARFGVLVLFQNERSCPLSHYKTVAVFIEGTSGVLGLVITLRHRPHGRESTE